MAVVKNSEVVTVEGVEYTVTEMGALAKVRCFTALGDDPTPLQQMEAMADALSKSVFIGGELAFKDMEAAGDISLEAFNALSEAFARVHGPKE